MRSSGQGVGCEWIMTRKAGTSYTFRVVDYGYKVWELSRGKGVVDFWYRQGANDIGNWIMG